MIVVSAFYK